MCYAEFTLLKFAYSYIVLLTLLAVPVSLVQLPGVPAGLLLE